MDEELSADDDDDGDVNVTPEESDTNNVIPIHIATNADIDFNNNVGLDANFLIPSDDLVFNDIVGSDTDVVINDPDLVFIEYHSPEGIAFAD